MKIHSALSIVLMSVSLIKPVAAQQNTDQDVTSVLAADSSFWQHYNNCNMDGMRSFLADDLEFYHDKGGITRGADNLIAISKKNLCSNDNFRLRRDVVAGTVKVSLLKNNDVVYGAVISGRHLFFIIEPGKEPKRDGLATFTHLLLKTEKGWKISRVLSYDHGPAPYVNQRKEIVPDQKVLRTHSGNYKSAQSGLCAVKQEGNLLTLSVGGKDYVLHPETNSLFFVPERDLTFEFTSDKMIVRENGNIVDQGKRVK